MSQTDSPPPVAGTYPLSEDDITLRTKALATLLLEKGLVSRDVDESVEIKVWDTSAEIRYWVLPERPAGTEGMSEQELAGLVTREAMIGVADVEAP